MKNAKKKAQLDKVNVAKVTKEITDKKDLKYNYPKEVATLEDRKKFRATVRRKLKSYQRDAISLQKSKEKGAKTELHNLEKEIKSFKQEVLVND